jgi:predicted nucleic acid-binding protein
MILADTSIWIDHLRAGDERLVARLNAGQVLSHPFVAAELALGNLGRRGDVLGALGRLPQAAVASDAELLGFIDNHRLWGQGIGLVDVHLLAATALTPDARLWTRDRRLEAAAEALGMAASA